MNARIDVSLRATVPSDFAAIRRLFDDPAFFGWGGPGRRSDAELHAKYLGARLPDVECFLVVGDGEAVGLAQLHLADDGGEGGGIDLILLPSARGCGIGRAAVEALISRAREVNGWRRITVDPDAENTRGIAFWRSVGFTQAARVDDDPGRDPYVLMTLSDGNGEPQRADDRTAPIGDAPAAG